MDREPTTRTASRMGWLRGWATHALCAACGDGKDEEAGSRRKPKRAPGGGSDSWDYYFCAPLFRPRAEIKTRTKDSRISKRRGHRVGEQTLEHCVHFFCRLEVSLRNVAGAEVNVLAAKPRDRSQPLLARGSGHNWDGRRCGCGALGRASGAGAVEGAGAEEVWKGRVGRRVKYGPGYNSIRPPVTSAGPFTFTDAGAFYGFRTFCYCCWLPRAATANHDAAGCHCPCREACAPADRRMTLTEALPKTK